MKVLIYTGLILSALTTCHCWDNEQLEVFDVVEEVKENFYEMLSLSNNATSKEIKSAFRRLSLVLHPDKNPHEDAAMQFRNLVSVYEVLKDEKKRAYYDDVLVNGMPNWKSAMFYYRSVRKIGLFEGALILFGIITVGQYLVAWAAYAEKLFTLQQVAKQRKGKKNSQGAVIVEMLAKPSVLHTLPFQIPYWSYQLVVSIPSFLILTKDLVNERIEERREAAAQALKEEQEEEEAAAWKATQSKKKKKTFAIPEGPTFEANYGGGSAITENTVAPPPISGGFWSDDDLDELVKLVKKYPGGTAKRWEVIAECMNRSVGEVTFMANRMKTAMLRQPAEEEPIAEEKVKVKTKGGKLEGAVEEAAWLQSQQRALEDALAKFPKGAADRWERIAELVPNKTKEECMLRYKHLVEVIRKQRGVKEE